MSSTATDRAPEERAVAPSKFPVFQSFKRFGFVHHRALNARETLAAAARMAEERPDFEHVAEGDLCWHVTPERTVFYFRHPKRLRDRLTLRQIESARASGELFTLDDLLEAPPDNLRFIIELKVGTGRLSRAMAELAERLQGRLRGRFWVAAFSPRLLQQIKRADATVPTSLHTKIVWRHWILGSAPERRPLSLHRMRDFDAADAITINYENHWARPLQRMGRSLDDIFAGVTAAGKQLVFCGLRRPERFEAARDSAAIAAYARFPVHELPVRYDSSVGPGASSRVARSTRT